MADSPAVFRLECLTPIHIGSGSAFARDFDFIYRDGATELVDTERVLEILPGLSGVTAEDVKEDLKRKIRRVLENAGPKLPELLRARVTGKIEASSIREAIRAGDGRPIIPGSSLKGALRTMLLAGWSGDDGPHSARRSELAGPLTEAMTKLRSRFAARPLEDAVFRNGFVRRGDVKLGPHTDVLRTLSIPDAPFAPACVAIFSSVAVNTRRETLTAVEALKPDASSAVAINLGDEFVASRLLTRPLPPQETIARWSREHALYLLRADARFFRELANPATVLAERLEALARKIEAAPPGSIFLRLGWGAGWRTMTGDILEPAEREQVLRRGGPHVPKTRKVVLDGHSRTSSPANVFGWISLSPISRDEAHELLSRAHRPEPLPAAPAQPATPPAAQAGGPARTAQVDTFEQQVRALNASQKGRVRALIEQAARTADAALRERRLAMLAEQLVRVFGKDRRWMQQLLQDKNPGPHIKTFAR